MEGKGLSMIKIYIRDIDATKIKDEYRSDYLLNKMKKLGNKSELLEIQQIEIDSLILAHYTDSIGIEEKITKAIKDGCLVVFYSGAFQGIEKEEENMLYRMDWKILFYIIEKLPMNFDLSDFRNAINLYTNRNIPVALALLCKCVNMKTSNIQITLYQKQWTTYNNKWTEIFGRFTKEEILKNCGIDPSNNEQSNLYEVKHLIDWIYKEQNEKDKVTTPKFQKALDQMTQHFDWKV